MAFKIKYNAPIILSFSLLCVGVYVLNYLTPGSGLIHLFAVGSTLDLGNPFTIVGLFTHPLGHANLEHLLGNLTLILLIGPIAEEKYGSRGILTMILITALITGLLNVFLFDTGLLGASGIGFMLILLVSFTNVKAGEIPVSFILVALLYIGKEFMNSFQPDYISQFAHIIGGVCGSIFGFTGLGNSTSAFK